MSGPKTSRYTLTPEQRRILAEQRKIERQKSIAQEKIKRNSKKILQIGSRFTQAMAVAKQLKQLTGEDGGLLKGIKKLDDAILQVNKAVASKKDEVQSLQSVAKVVEEQLAEAEKIAKQLDKIAVKNQADLDTRLHSDIKQVSQVSFCDLKTKDDASATKEKLLNELNQAFAPTLPNQLQLQLKQAVSNLQQITDPTFLKNFASVTVAPLLKLCKTSQQEFETYHQQFESLYAEYVALCNLYFYVPQQFEFSKESIKQLGEEIDRIILQSAEEAENNYISDCLDQVMTEMGYDVLGYREVKKKNGQRFKNELYSYKEGTVVNVRYAPNGQIAMEIGAVDTVDRQPDQYEATALCQSMETFCQDFKEIEKRLLAKGVVLEDRISMLPASKEYAQVINTTEYELTASAVGMQKRSQTKATQKKKALRSE